VRTEYHAGAVQFHLAVEADPFVCPECRSREVIRKGSRERSWQTVPLGFKGGVLLVTEVPTCEGKDCGAKFEVAPFLPPPTCITPKSSRRTQTRSAG
jgi:hypothetical protein